MIRGVVNGEVRPMFRAWSWAIVRDLPAKRVAYLCWLSASGRDTRPYLPHLLVDGCWRLA